jgi:hypothetical protein
MWEYLSEAERTLAVVGRLLREVKSYTLSAGQKWIRLVDIPEVIELRSSQLAVGGRYYPLKIVDAQARDADVPSLGSDTDYGEVSTSLASNAGTGRPRAIVVGRRTNHLELVPASDGIYTVELALVTYPPVRIDAADVYPTIPERYHPDIAIGAALFAIDGSESEHFNQPRVQSLGIAWQRAQIRASQETAVQQRDAGTVQFNGSGLW